MNCVWTSKTNKNIMCNHEADESGYCLFHKKNKSYKEEIEFIRLIKSNKISDFRGFVFCGYIEFISVIDYCYEKLDFSEAIFKERVCFETFNFKENVNFDYVVFDKYCSFKDAVFFKDCTFNKSTFSHKNIKEKIFEKCNFNGQLLSINNVGNLPRLDGIKFSSASKIILYNIKYKKEDAICGKINFRIARIQAKRISNYERVGYYYYNERIYGSKFMNKDEYINNKEYISAKFFDGLSRYCIGYGERPWNVFYLSLFIISIFAVFYMMLGLENSNGEIILINLGNLKSFSFSEIIDVYIKSWYFSVITFATIGYGDFVAINSISRILVGVEVFFGLTLASTWASLIIKRMIK